MIYTLLGIGIGIILTKLAYYIHYIVVEKKNLEKDNSDKGV